MFWRKCTSLSGLNENKTVWVQMIKNGVTQCVETLKSQNKTVSNEGTFRPICV